MTDETGHFAVLRRSFSRDLRRPAHPGRDHRLLLRRAARGAGRLRHAGRDHRGDADRARLQADQGRRRSRSWPTPRRSRSARSRSRSSRWPRSPGCPRTTSARWSAARRRSSPSFVPLILVGMVDGMRGIRQAWPAAMVGGLAFALGQFACSNYVSVELTDIVASLLVRRRDRRAAAGLAARPSRCAASAGRRAARDRRRGGRRPGATRREVRRKRRQRPRQPRGDDLRRLRAVPDHHRDLLARPVGADQGLPRRARRRRSTGRA